VVTSGEGNGSRAPARALLDQWHNGIRIRHRAHEQAATLFAKRGRILAVAALALSTVVGTAIFSTLTTSPATTWKIVTGMLSVTVAVLSALQALLEYPELAERHRQAALALGRLRHHVELLLVDESNAVNKDMLNGISTEWDAILLKEPSLPQRLYRRVEAEVLGRGRDAPT
jgi:SMODS and SLOG-associating 2TM effector domain family 4